MVKNHLKRLVMPTTWTTKEKKSVTWVARPNAGAHPLNEGMPILLIFRELLGLANTAREVRYMMKNKQVLVDGKRRTDYRFNVGLMDVISLPDIKEQYRISINNNRKLAPVKIDAKEANQKVCKIKGKGFYNGKMQLRLSDGRVILADKGKYHTSDSIIISLPDQKIVEHLQFEKGSSVLLTGGKFIGKIGNVQEIKDETVVIKSKDETFETLKKYCYVVGKQKPALTIA
jgi:small subunit ribosomal protein S4e